MSRCFAANKIPGARYLSLSPWAREQFKIILFLGFVAWFLIISGNPSMAASEGGAPSIKFISLLFEAGKVKEGQKITHTFEFENQGQGVLRIVNIESG